MPVPRAAGARRASSRLSTAESDEDKHSSPGSAGMSRPKLPQLAATPASRRQYTYGSAVEPPPSRPGRMEPLDLGHAVGQALNRQQQEDKNSKRAQMPPPARPGTEEEDELSNAELAAPQLGRPGKPASRQRRAEHNSRSSEPTEPAAAGQPTRQQLEDMRDDRSFGTESDYYGNASIRSSPAPTPKPLTRSTRKAAQKKSSLRQEALEVVEEAPSAVQPPHEPLDLDPEPAAPARTATRPEDTLSVRRPRQSSKRASAQPESRSQAPTETQPLHTTIEQASASSNFRAAPRPSTRQGDPKAFIKPNQMLAPSFASNHSEADDAMQRDIAASEVDSEATSPMKSAWIRVKSFASSPSAKLPPWLRGEAEQDPGSSPPPQAVASRMQPVRDYGAQPAPAVPPYSEEEAGGDAINWWYILRPRTYIDVLLRFVDAVTDYVERLVLTLLGFLRSKRFWQRALGVFAAALVAALAVGNADTLADLVDSAGDSLPSAHPSRLLSGLSGVAGQVGEMASSIRIPSIRIPAIPIPSFRRQDDFSSIWDLDESERHELEAYFRKFDNDFRDLRSASSLHDASFEKLERILPRIVHVRSSDGRLSIGEDFYHAVRARLSDDDSILTFDDKAGEYVVRSDRQWRSLVHGIANDPHVDGKLNASMSSIESRLGSKMTSFWDSWIKDNDHKIKAQLGTALEDLKAANSEAELDQIVRKLVKDQIRASSADDGVLVTREEFIKHVRREVDVHRHEIRAELDDLRPQLKALIQETIRVAGADQAQHAAMTRDEITALANSLIRKAIAETDLRAMAEGKIHAHWDADLKNQVNYFAVGSGAFADPKLSSATYDPHNQGLASMKAYAQGLRGAKPLPPLAALQRWDDEGDCWCAAREVNRRGNPHGATLSVLMGHQVVPQHVVVEHILPGATSDPGARPREVEVHIRIEDPETLSRVQDFSATHFSEPDHWDHQPAALGPQFVKVGQFTYEGAELHGGVHVQRLSRELVELGAETDQVVLRAVSNYGAKEHTCFYRVRLYGERIGLDV